jgi:hypothetical protein
MPEPLLAATSVKLFGQVVLGLTLDLSAAGGGENGPFKGLADKLRVADPQLARIYGFSHEGQYYDLARPAIFLVDGPGTAVGNELPETRIAVTPPELAGGVSAWDYDRDDFSLRLDLDVGPLDRILLDAELGPDRARYAGADIRLRQAGADVRLRHAGADVRLRGGRGGGISD